MAAGGEHGDDEVGAGGGLGGGGLMGIGQSRARRYDQESARKITFDDVAGIDEAENELVEIVDFLRDPEKYTRLGGTAPTGVLLVGAPGTGKTLLAKAVANESDAHFIYISGPELVSKFVGESEETLRELFREAQEKVSAVQRRLGEGYGDGGHGAREGLN